MVNIFPGYATSQWNVMNSTENNIFITEHCVLIGLYFVLLILVLANIWVILIRQGKYKTLPLLAFYVFGSMAIFLRLVFLECAFTDSSIFLIIAEIQSCSKLCTGLI